MSWLANLHETFENNQVLQDTNENPLIPICHTTQQAHIEVVLNGEGEFLRASVVQRDDNTTLIPCTESSGSRAGVKPVNHPLCDKLQYVAGDFIEFGGVVTTGFAKEPKEPHLSFLNDLQQWINSPYGHTKLNAVLRYVKRASLISDLVDYGVLHLNNKGLLLEQWDGGGESPAIFKVIGNNQGQWDGFVRWVVEIPGKLETKVWRDQDLIQAWIDYYISTITEKDLCYVTGAMTAIALFHPAKIRNDGDKAKLISGNDDSGFTFRGRFETDSQAASVGFEVTQKAHNMLRWLIRNQGFRSGDLAIVAWAVKGGVVPNPVDASVDLLGGPGEQNVAYTAEEFALKLKKKIFGLQVELGQFTNINVIGLDSATPGRMSISFYRELSSSEFLSRLENWHNIYAWQHSYRPKNAPHDYPRLYVGTPSLFEIAEATYGIRLDSKLRAKTIERLLPCIIEGQTVPHDIVNIVVRRAANRVAFEDEREWTKTLTIACSLYKGANIKEGYTLALDTGRVSRDYLYGRLLAYADNLERWSLTESDGKRATNAARAMARFAERPYSTWRNLELSLRPYLDRLGVKSLGLQKGVSEVMNLFDAEDFVNDRPLSGEFLLGYHCQKMAFWDKTDEETVMED